MPKKIPLSSCDEEKLNEVKFRVCEAIDRSICRHQWNYTQAAHYLKTSKPVISRISNKKCQDLTLNQLFACLVRVKPDFEFLISI